MDLRSIYLSTFADFRETNTFSSNSYRKTKSSTLLNTINRCRMTAANGLALEANFETSSIDKNMQKTLYDFLILKLWSIASTHVRAFATFSPTAKSTYLGQI